MYKNTLLMVSLVLCTSAFAKLPALSDEAKAKAAEVAAKTVWSGKLDAFALCKSQNKAAASYFKAAKAAGKETKPATDMPACADPGTFVYVPALGLPASTAVSSATAKPA